MKPNIGNTDKAIRVMLAVIFTILYFTNVITGTLGIVMLILGGVFFLTAFIGICPLYLPFGLCTSKSQSTD